MSAAATDPGARNLPDTHWSQLMEAGDAGDPRHVQHLDRLLRRYWKPVYYYVRTIRDVSPQDAEDITQGFFEMVLGSVDLAKLSPERGSFRGFLKKAIHRYVSRRERDKATRTRLERQALFPYNETEALLRTDPQGDVTPEEAFDRAWAREVIGEALARLENELGAEGKSVYVKIFRQYCLEPTPEVSYESLAAEHGLKVSDVRNHLTLVRDRGWEIVKDLVRDYLLPGEQFEDELRFIFAR